MVDIIKKEKIRINFMECVPKRYYMLEKDSGYNFQKALLDI